MISFPADGPLPVGVENSEQAGGDIAQHVAVEKIRRAVGSDTADYHAAAFAYLPFSAGVVDITFNGQ